MPYSARKPYYKLKLSIAQMFKAAVYFLKELNQKFSEFEKPYFESEYPQMHLNIPSNDWERWNPSLPQIHWTLPKGGDPPPRSSFIPPSKDDPERLKRQGCTIYDGLPPLLTPGMVYLIVIWMYVNDPVPPENVEVFTGPAEVYPYPFREAALAAHVAIDTDGKTGETVVITARTRSGKTCSTTGMVWQKCEGAAIEYSSAYMDVDTSQVLSSADGKNSDWKVTGDWGTFDGGATEVNGAWQVTYDAPTEPPDTDCDRSSVVTMSRGSEICDTLTIRPGTYEAEIEAYRETVLQGMDCAYVAPVDPGICPSGWRWWHSVTFKWFKYDCFDTYIGLDNEGYCSESKCCCGDADCDEATDDNDCGSGTCPECYAAGEGEHGPLNTPIDMRTQAMKDGGCCPDALM